MTAQSWSVIEVHHILSFVLFNTTIIFKSLSLEREMEHLESSHAASSMSSQSRKDPEDQHKLVFKTILSDSLFPSKSRFSFSSTFSVLFIFSLWNVLGSGEFFLMALGLNSVPQVGGSLHTYC
jgi:hypothetical protein